LPFSKSTRSKTTVVVPTSIASPYIFPLSLSILFAFGSDVYYPEGRDISVQIAAIKGAKIKEREKENILYKNAKRILLEGLK